LFGPKGFQKLEKEFPYKSEKITNFEKDTKDPQENKLEERWPIDIWTFVTTKKVNI
jgi:hypothetical protein